MARKLRALHIIGDSKFGGDSIVVCEWLKMLEARGFEVTLLATDEPVVDLAREQGLNVWTFKGIQRSINPFVDIPAIFRLAWALRGKYDIVHTNTTKGGAIGRAAAWLARIPVVLHTIHGFAFHEFSGRLPTFAVASVERILTRMCDRIIFVNDFDRLRAIKLRITPEDKAVTVFNGISEDRLKPGLSVNRAELLEELNLEEDCFLSVNVGRLAEQKGLGYLIEALSIVRRKMPELNLHQVMVGDGELHEQCQAWTKEHNVDDRVHFLGFRSDALRWTGGADVFVLSSLWEGHSITLLEAMGCGTPIIATDIKGNRESITDEVDGLLVRPADADSLAEAFIRMASDRDLGKQLGKQARKTYEERFTLAHMLDSTWDVYEKLLSDKGLL